jgi:hypothetical protein
MEAMRIRHAVVTTKDWTGSCNAVTERANILCHVQQIWRGYGEALDFERLFPVVNSTQDYSVFEMCLLSGLPKTVWLAEYHIMDIVQKPSNFVYR